MKTKRVFLLVFSVWLLGAAGAFSQDTGACWSSIACLDGLTQADCTSLGGINWQANFTCADTGIEWSGGCIATLPVIGESCQLVTSAANCGGGRYLGDGVFCGAEEPEPVPTLPVSGRAVLTLALLTGALLVIKRA